MVPRFTYDGGDKLAPYPPRGSGPRARTRGHLWYKVDSVFHPLMSASHFRLASVAIGHARRALRASPITTAFSLLVLAAGIAASTTAFSVVDAVILRSLPFENSERLVYVGPA